MSAADDIHALRMGIFAFAVFVAAFLGSLVAGRALVDDYDPHVFSTFLVATLAPLPICGVVIAAGYATGNGDRPMWTALFAGAAVGSAGGGFIAALRERAAEESFHDRVSRREVATSRGWRSA